MFVGYRFLKDAFWTKLSPSSYLFSTMVRYFHGKSNFSRNCFIVFNFTVNPTIILSTTTKQISCCRLLLLNHLHHSFWQVSFKCFMIMQTCSPKHPQQNFISMVWLRCDAIFFSSPTCIYLHSFQIHILLLTWWERNIILLFYQKLLSHKI